MRGDGGSAAANAANAAASAAAAAAASASRLACAAPALSLGTALAAFAAVFGSVSLRAVLRPAPAHLFPLLSEVDARAPERTVLRCGAFVAAALFAATTAAVRAHAAATRPKRGGQLQQQLHPHHHHHHHQLHNQQHQLDEVARGGSQTQVIQAVPQLLEQHEQQRTSAQQQQHQPQHQPQQQQQKQLPFPPTARREHAAASALVVKRNRRPLLATALFALVVLTIHAVALDLPRHVRDVILEPVVLRSLVFVLAVLWLAMFFFLMVASMIKIVGLVFALETFRISRIMLIRTALLAALAFAEYSAAFSFSAFLVILAIDMRRASEAEAALRAKLKLTRSDAYDAPLLV